MESNSIRLPIRNLPEHFDRSRITVVLQEIEMALMDDGGVYGKTFADSFTIPGGETDLDLLVRCSNSSGSGGIDGGDPGLSLLRIAAA